jgi:hypothetical protein
MLKHLDQLADRSCWISGERINACIGVDAHGIAEIGFHGTQPVSRNSRMLVREHGVLSLAIRNSEGEEEEVTFDRVEWHPHKVSVAMAPWGRRMELDIVAMDRAVLVNVTGDVQGCQLCATFFPESGNVQVRGERTWFPPSVGAHWLLLQCRDRIRSREWLRQEGPYAGDFLIPEPWRRILFARSIRSGQATAADLRPEYRDADITLYDATTTLRIGSDDCSIEQHQDRIRFFTHLKRTGSRIPALLIAGTERNEAIIPSTEEYRERGEKTDALHKELERVSLRLTADGMPELAEWFSSVPGIIQSCTVSESGMTRATPGAYYWLWAWDNMVTGAETLRWGAHALVADMVRFINTHRDLGGSIPARWTRSGQPLDTPSRGALEFLLLHVAYQYTLETGDRSPLLDVYPHAVAHLRAIARTAGGKGLVPNIGFYPDLPLRFGRTEQSLVALEIGCLYGFARILENAAAIAGDAGILDESRVLAADIERSFLNTFWDEERGYLIDAIDAETRERNITYPLFSLLFLQTPLGIPLLRRVLPQMGRFMSGHLQTEYGTRILPAWDRHQGSEQVASSWYPHWDIYLLKVLRRTGQRDGIMRWLHAARLVLRRLGYVPEFLMLDRLTQEPSDGWLRHGAVSNLNCLTGWYHGVIEGLFGLEMDPGGMGVVPLDLPLGPLRLQGLHHRGARWDIRIEHKGSSLTEIRIDGTLLRGTMKIPSTYHGQGQHELLMWYGDSPGGPRFKEILNAEVLESEGDSNSASVQVRVLGTADIVVDNAQAAQCELDGKLLKLDVDPRTGTGTARIVSVNTHTLSLKQKS